MRTFFFFCFWIILSLSAVTSSANTYNKIKLAVFDNPQPDPSRAESTQELLSAYQAGIHTAIVAAQSKGIIINEKDFFHGSDLPDIVQQAANVKTWDPDIVLGFNGSNDFIMSRAFFSDQLILSVSATDQKLSSMPKEFYSLGIPDTYAVSTIISFINKHYPHANLFITVAAESKESVDFSDLLAKNYKNKNPSRRVIERRFLTDDMQKMNFANFMSGYQKGDIIVVMSIGYNSALDLMNKIANYLAPYKPTFVTSTDSWGNDVTPVKLTNNYDAYRIDTLAGGVKTKDFDVFASYYQKIYHKEPVDKISFVTYQSVMSFVEALIKYPPPPNLSTKDAVLWSYQQALKRNPNWFRPPQYVVYKLQDQKEIYFDTIVRNENA
jgi:hypothetical protein